MAFCGSDWTLVVTRTDRHKKRRTWTWDSDSSQHGSSNDTGSNSVYTDTERTKFSGQRQRHGHNTSLAGGIGGLTNLAVEGGNRSDIDDNTTFTCTKRRWMRTESSTMDCAIREYNDASAITILHG